MNSKNVATAAVLTMCATLAACGGGGTTSSTDLESTGDSYTASSSSGSGTSTTSSSTSPSTSSGSTSGDVAAVGRLNLAVTDAPVDAATAVVVEFSGVEIKPASGAAVEFYFCAAEEDAVTVSEEPCDEPGTRSIDLLALQGGGSAMLLDGVEVPAGDYNWMRLKVNAVRNVIDSYIELEDGGVHSLYIPGGEQTGLKLVSGFNVPDDGVANYTIDFDLRKSVHKPQGHPDYVLKPALRLISNGAAGRVAGSVAPEMVNHESCTGGDAVYVWSGADAVPMDVRGTDSDPIATASVELDAETGNYTYAIGFLEAGEYTFAFTCQASSDDPAAEDELEFVAVSNVAVSAGTTVQHDFTN